jgi:PAS domain S-box-containing protein
MNDGRFDLRRAYRSGILLVIAAALFLASAQSYAQEQPRRVLLLSAYNYTLPSATQVIDGVEKRLNELGEKKFVIDAEFLDLVRATDPDHEFRTAIYVREKYAKKPPDIVIAIGGTALQFFMKYRDIVGSQIPVVFAGVAPTTFSALHIPPNITGVLFKLDLEKTLDLAEHLQPNARQLFVIAGSSSVEDKNWQQAARRTIEQRERTYQTTYLFGLSFDALISEVSKLPSDAIVVMLSFLLDGAGSSFIGRDVATEVARVSPAPVYAPYDTYIGNGVVGGFVETFESHGAAVADLVSEISDGKDPTTLPPRANPAQTFRVDSRALDRWHLNRSALPSGTVALFHEPSLWTQYRLLISTTAAVVALQSVLLFALLVQRRRRWKAERSLKESEDRMTFVATSMNIGLWQFDRATDELWATEHSRTMFGVAHDIPLTRETFLSAVHRDDRRMAVAALRGTWKGRSVTTDVRVVHPDGQVRWIRLRTRSHLDETGTLDQLIGVFVDITDQKAAESEAELHRQEVTHLMRVSVLGELSGAIAHEVNQPLTAILSNAQAALYLLDRDSPNLAEVRDALRDIVNEDNRAGDVVHRLRSLLKKGEARSEPVDVNEVVDSAVALLRSELINRRVMVETDLAAGQPTVFGDSVQFQQVLLNLIMNAMDAMNSTPEPQRRILICTQETTDGSVEVLVKDNGSGIKQVDGKQLFVPFHTTKDHGLGLGLTICSTIIRKHGGTIDLQNDAAGGAIARISLPARVMMMAAQ